MLIRVWSPVVEGVGRRGGGQGESQRLRTFIFYVSYNYCNLQHNQQVTKYNFAENLIPVEIQKTSLIPVDIQMTCNMRPKYYTV